MAHSRERKLFACASEIEKKLMQVGEKKGYN
jgi:hypothetical protein